MNFEFNLRTKTYIGKGSILRINDFLEGNNYKRVGFIIDDAVKNNPFITEFILQLEKKKSIAVKWNYDLPFEPDYNSLDEKKKLFKNGTESLVDVIIVIGGGSVMDFGKGIATLITNHEPAITYRGFPKGLNKSIPVVAVPTTAGTGSEVTFNAVFTDTDSGKKLGINTHNNFPVLAVLDSNMTIKCPFNVALSSGLDALVHTFESFACNNSNEFTRIFAKEAFVLLYKNIESALLEPENDQARENMLFGAYLAGVSLFNAGSGPAGALSYPMGVVCKVPHGIAGGFILPYLVQYNVQNGYTKYSELYNAVFASNADFLLKTDKEKSDRLVSLIFELYDRLKVWELTKKYHVDINSTQLKEYIALLQGAFDQNPVKILTSEGYVFLEKIFTDKVLK
jgi:alcohol dehydrogenase class IV